MLENLMIGSKIEETVRQERIATYKGLSILCTCSTSCFSFHIYPGQGLSYPFKSFQTLSYPFKSGQNRDRFDVAQPTVECPSFCSCFRSNSCDKSAIKFGASQAPSVNLSHTPVFKYLPPVFQYLPPVFVITT